MDFSVISTGRIYLHDEGLMAEKGQKIVSHLTHYTVLLRKPCAARLSGATPPLSEV